MPRLTTSVIMAQSLLGHGASGVVVNSVLLIILVFILVGIILFVISEVYYFLISSNQPLVSYELIPPAGLKQLQSSQALFDSIYSISTLKNRFSSRPFRLSLEISATKTGRISFIMVVPAAKAEFVKKLVYAAMPEVKLKPISLRPTKLSHRKIISYRLSASWQRPLKTIKDINNHDPLTNLIKQLSNLKVDEQAVLQLVIKPNTSHDLYRKRQRIIKPTSHQATLLSSLIWPFYLSAAFIVDIYLDILLRPKLVTVKSDNIDNSDQKFYKPLFTTSIRLYLASNNLDDIKTNLSGLKSVMSMFGSSQQSLITNISINLFNNLSDWFFIKRLVNLFSFHTPLLSAEELAAIYHFPKDLSSVNSSFNKSLSASPNKTNHIKNDIILGQNEHHEKIQLIGLSAAQRHRHLYIMGGTGTGKTSLLRHMIMQDIRSGKGLTVIDPHGDLAESLIKDMPKARLKDLTYFNPVNLKTDIVINPLEIPKGLNAKNLTLAQDFTTEAVVSLFRKVFSEENSGGHRLEYILRNTIATAYLTTDPTLETVYRLLTDPKFRYETVEQIDQTNLKNFWKNEFNLAGSMQRVKLSFGVTSKLGRFLSSEVVSQILTKPHSTINFDNLLDNNQILICNLAKGYIGEDNSYLLGAVVLTKLQLAAYRRQSLAVKDRSAHFLYVDEFQNYATESFIGLLSEARKFGLYMNLAEQSPSQFDDDKKFNILLSNVGNLICFRSGSPKDESLVLPLFEPYLKKGDILNMGIHRFFLKTTNKEAIEPISVETII